MGGLGHDFKVGVNFINEPRLFITFNIGQHRLLLHPPRPTTSTGPISAVTREQAGASANMPMKQFGIYFQDDWRVTDRFTVNVGLRYDIMTGFDIDQSRNPNYVKLTGAAAAGRFNGVPGFEEFGNKPARTRTTSSRASAPSTTCAATARTSSAPAGASTTTSATRTRTSCSRA